jgi:hypothetical protein
MEFYWSAVEMTGEARTAAVPNEDYAIKSSTRGCRYLMFLLSLYLGETRCKYGRPYSGEKVTQPRLETCYLQIKIQAPFGLTSLLEFTPSPKGDEERCKTMLLFIVFVKLNSVALVREQTLPTERPPLVGEVSANVFADRGYRVVSATDSLRSLISIF